VAWDRDNLWRLMFGILNGPAVDASLASALAQAIARSRLRHPDLLDSTELATVRPQTDRIHLQAAAGNTEAVGIPGAHSIGFNPGQVAERHNDAINVDHSDEPAAPAPAPALNNSTQAQTHRRAGSRVCPNLVCEAAGLPTPLETCDLCASRTEVRPEPRTSVTGPPTGGRRSTSAAPAQSACQNGRCEAFALPTQLPACDLCGTPTIPTAAAG
jgi:hypothetical protein